MERQTNCLSVIAVDDYVLKSGQGLQARGCGNVLGSAKGIYFPSGSDSTRKDTTG